MDYIGGKRLYNNKRSVIGMKKIGLKIISIIILVISLIGCGKNTKTEPESTVKEETVVEETVAEEVPEEENEEAEVIIDEETIIEEARGYIFVDPPQKDINKATEILKPIADNGNAEAQYLMGWISDYEVPETNETDKEALEWYRKAMEQGHLKSYLAGCANSCSTYDEVLEWQEVWRNSNLSEINDMDGLFLLGCCYNTGIDFIPDMDKTIEYYEKSAEMGYTRAMNALGDVLEDGEKAFEYYEKASEKNDPDGKNNLGYCYTVGFGVEQDITRGLKLLEEAGEAGSSAAYSNLGYIYENGYDAIEKDANKAIEYYSKAAELGKADCYAYISIIYELGNGVEVDIEKAMEYAKKGTEEGSGYAAYGVAYLYENKLNDAEEAKIWYEKSANLGYEDSILKVASQYLNEQTDESFKKAIDLYKIGMRNGSAESFCNLGAMYHMGHGVEKDNVMAAKLLITAEKRGSENATQLMQASEIKEEVEKIKLENN